MPANYPSPNTQGLTMGPQTTAFITVNQSSLFIDPNYENKHELAQCGSLSPLNANAHFKLHGTVPFACVLTRRV